MKLVKMHGLGNDYVYADCINEMIENPAELAIKISDRHFGVGSDGLILICPSKKAEFEMRLYNADGSYALMCGNGIRCVGKYLYDNGYVTKDYVDIESGGQVKHLKLKIENGECVASVVDMGVPLIPGVKGWTDSHVQLEVDGEMHDLTLVDMGNPHGVKFIDDVESLEIEKIGPKLEKHEFFPDRANIEFIQVVDDHTLNMRVWERGSGETFACGTGATAAAVAAILNGYCKPGEVLVHLRGGDLLITWDGKGSAFMEGSATYVFEITNLNL
jgi:diaminopimelate epimerase